MAVTVAGSNLVALAVCLMPRFSRSMERASARTCGRCALMFLSVTGARRASSSTSGSSGSPRSDSGVICDRLEVNCSGATCGRSGSGLGGCGCCCIASELSIIVKLCERMRKSQGDSGLCGTCVLLCV